MSGFHAAGSLAGTFGQLPSESRWSDASLKQPNHFLGKPAAKRFFHPFPFLKESGPGQAPRLGRFFFWARIGGKAMMLRVLHGPVPSFDPEPERRAPRAVGGAGSLAGRERGACECEGVEEVGG